jgi:hypothetical protein
MKYESNRGKAEQYIEAQLKKKMLAIAHDYERILDDEFRAPKDGRVYGKAKAVKRFGKRKAKLDQLNEVFAGTDKEVTGAAAQKFMSSAGRGVHIASAPGEAPAIWFAHLRKGVMHVIDLAGELMPRLRIGVSVESGRGGPQGSTGRSIADDLEFGTSRIAPRPAWRPALQALIAKMKA